MFLKDYASCSTSGCKKLDEQLIAQTNKISPGCLLYFGDLQRVKCGAGCHPFLQLPALDAFKKAIATRPNVVFQCNSAYRTIAQQFILYNHHCYRRCGITAAAIPGNSNHNSGLALDIEDPEGWRPYLERFGWRWLGARDRWHFDYVGTKDAKVPARDIRQTSVQAFQQLWNANRAHYTDIYFELKEDGLWSDRVKQALLYANTDGFKFGAVTVAKPVLPVVSPVALNSPLLRRGDKGQDVKELQKALNSKSSKLSADGDFGAATEKAVKAFQSDRGLTADGIVGKATWEALI